MTRNGGPGLTAVAIVRICHWTVVGLGLPSLADAVKVAVCPGLTVTLVGLFVTVGA